MTKYNRWRAQPEIQARARQLRREMTPAERKLWARLRYRQLEGLHFRKQHPVGRFIVDFYCAKAKLIIEIDGDTHAALDQAEYDQTRTIWLEAQGYRVIRFQNADVHKNLEIVLMTILEAAAKSPHP